MRQTCESFRESKFLELFPCSELHSGILLSKDRFKRLSLLIEKKELVNICNIYLIKFWIIATRNRDITNFTGNVSPQINFTMSKCEKILQHKWNLKTLILFHTIQMLLRHCTLTLQEDLYESNGRINLCSWTLYENVISKMFTVFKAIVDIPFTCGFFYIGLTSTKQSNLPPFRTCSFTPSFGVQVVTPIVFFVHRCSFRWFIRHNCTPRLETCN